MGVYISRLCNHDKDPVISYKNLSDFSSDDDLYQKSSSHLNNNSVKKKRVDSYLIDRSDLSTSEDNYSPSSLSNHSSMDCEDVVRSFMSE